MKEWKTTVVGMALAAAMSLEKVDGVPSWLHGLAVAIVPALTALLGYLATDRATTGADTKRIGVVIALVCCASVLTGCTVAGFGLKLTGTPFGSLAVQVDGGSVGKGTNAVAQKVTLNQGTNCTYSTNAATGN